MPTNSRQTRADNFGLSSGASSPKARTSCAARGCARDRKQIPKTRDHVADESDMCLLNRHPLRQRSISAVLAAAVLASLVAAVGWSAPAGAAPATQSYFLRGDFTTVGNTLGVTATLTDGDSQLGAPDVPANAAATVRSSSDVLTLPAGATVVAATLYLFQSNLPTLTVGAAPAAAQLSIDGGDYEAHALTEVGVGTSGGVGARLLRSDVTSAFAGFDGDARIWAGMATTEAVWSWAIFVVYEQASLPWRQIVINDLATGINAGGTITATIPALTVAPGERADVTVSSYVLFSTVGQTDYLRACEGTSPCTDLGAGNRTAENGYAFNAANPVGDIANRTFTRFGTQPAGLFPSPSAASSIDLDTFAVSGALPDTATSAAVSLISPQDTLFSGVIALSSTVYTPVPVLTNVASGPATSSTCTTCDVSWALTVDLDDAGSDGYTTTVAIPLPAGAVLDTASIATSGVGDVVTQSGNTLTWDLGTVTRAEAARSLSFKTSFDRATLNAGVAAIATIETFGLSPLTSPFTESATASVSAGQYPALPPTTTAAPPTTTTALPTASAAPTPDSAAAAGDGVTDPRSLADTGGAAETQTGAALALIVVGLLFVAMARRTRRLHPVSTSD